MQLFVELQAEQVCSLHTFDKTRKSHLNQLDVSKQRNGIDFWNSYSSCTWGKEWLCTR